MIFLASGGCGTVMLCNKLDDPTKKQYILKYINLRKSKVDGPKGPKWTVKMDGESKPSRRKWKFFLTNRIDLDCHG